MQVNSGERMDVPGEEGSTVGVFLILTLKGSPFQLDFGCPPPSVLDPIWLLSLLYL